MTILTRMVGVNLTEKIHLHKELKKIINSEGVGHESIIGKSQRRDPVLPSLQDSPNDPCPLVLVPLRAGFRREENKMWEK